MSSIRAYACCPKCNERSCFSPGDVVENVIEKCENCVAKLPPSEIKRVTEKLKTKQVVKKLTGRKIK